MTPSYLKRLAVLCSILAISGCGTTSSNDSGESSGVIIAVNPKLSVIQGPASAAVEARKQPISILVLHHTASSLPSALKTLQGRTKGHMVGVHYLVSAEVPQARIFRMCPDSLAAYHAGKSAWGKFESLNQSSLGIEIVNYDGNVHAYPKPQVEAVLALAQHLVTTHRISPENVVAHSDIAVGRKIDPGSLFPWEYFAANGVGAWPDAKDVQLFRILLKSQKLSNAAIQQLLRTYGYRLDDNSDKTLGLAIEAFQRHFRGSKVDGIADDETVAILQALVKKYRRGSSKAASPAPSRRV
ncbi:MAG: N-acetylmuramoyl-L-alanine amidase [Opitutia bacterium]|nr:MAG: N-acetylmuramoyl-L-alanine amidase [Opitutae bacterium]